MTVAPSTTARHPPRATAAPPPAATDTRQTLSTPTRRVLAVLRIGFGLTFLWAFFDKLLALGFRTGYDEDGELDRFGRRRLDQRRQPDRGLPEVRRRRPVQGVLQLHRRHRLGRLGVHARPARHRRGPHPRGGMRLAAAAGAVMYLLMWTVVLPPENNPVIDDHLLGAITLVALALLNAGNTWGLGHWWSRTELVEREPRAPLTPTVAKRHPRAGHLAGVTGPLACVRPVVMPCRSGAAAPATPASVPRGLVAGAAPPTRRGRPRGGVRCAGRSPPRRSAGRCRRRRPRAAARSSLTWTSIWAWSARACRATLETASRSTASSWSRTLARHGGVDGPAGAHAPA